MPKISMAFFTAVSLIISSVVATAAFKFEKGDNVCLIGNSLPDRFNHDGWFEAVLQSELKLLAKRTSIAVFWSRMIEKSRRSKDLYMAAVSLSLVLGGIWKPWKRGARNSVAMRCRCALCNE